MVRYVEVMVALVTISMVSGQIPCPAPNVHCDCVNIAFGEVTCANINLVPGSLPAATSLLDLSNNFLGPVLIKIHVDQLGSLPLDELILTNNGLEIIEDRSFDMLYNLTTLDISGNNIQALSDETLVGLKNLRYLYANDAGLVALPARMFESVPTLIYLDLEDNKLSEIGRELTPLVRLQELLLAENQIAQIYRESFSGFPSLVKMSLFGNKLRIPMTSWFTDIISNNGTVELDRRERSSFVKPNPWLCCPDVGFYHNFIVTLPRTLQSFQQLDVVCSWPVVISGRLMSTLSTEELNAEPCSDYTTTTVSTAFTTQTTATTTPSCSNGPSSVVMVNNFLGQLNDAGAFFVIFFVAVVTGICVGVCCCYYRTKRGRQRFHNIVNTFRPNHTPTTGKNADSVKSNTQLTTRPYRQQTSAYGSTGDVKGRQVANSEKPRRPAPPAPGKEGEYTDVVRPVEMTYSNYTMETDQSEEEVWSKTDRKNPV